MKIKPLSAAPLLAVVIFTLLCLSQLVPTSMTGENPYLSVIILELLVFALPSLFFCRLRGQKYGARIRFRLFEPGTIPFILTAALTLVLASCVLKLAVFSIFDSSPDITDIYEAYVPTANDASSVLYITLTFAIFPAITEELVFRGIMNAEYEVCGPLAAVIFSSLLFAMIHFDLKLFIVYFVSGVILSVVTYTCRSVLASMAVHAINNIFGLFFEDYIWNSILQPRNTVIFAFISVSLLLLLTVLLFGEAARIYKSYGRYGTESDYVVPRDERTPAVYGITSVPFAVCVLIFIFSVLL